LKCLRLHVVLCERGICIHREFIQVLADVVVILPIEGVFTYSVPEELTHRDLRGCMVMVPFGRRRISGIVIGTKPDQAEGVVLENIKTIESLLDDEPVFDTGMIDFLKWVSDYYIYPLGKVMEIALPPRSASFSVKRLSLTPEGEKALENAEAGTQDKKALECAQRKVSLRYATGAAGIKESVIKALQKKGLVEINEKLSVKQAKQRMEKWIKLNPNRIAEFQVFVKDFKKGAGKLLEFLMEHNEVEAGALRKRLPGAGRMLQGLLKKGFIEEIAKTRRRVPEEGIFPDGREHIDLNEHQQSALETISSSIKQREFGAFLLYGVTGSGKTEIYFRAIDEVLKHRRGAIYLVPEISLTPQLISWLRARFGDTVAVLHSGLSFGERHDEWQRLRAGKAQIVIGARSAVFAPLRDAGLIIVDEEHDSSYKQEDKLRYNARDIAMERARQNNACLILGSATPSVESFYNAIKEKASRLLTLPERVEKKSLPSVEIVNVRGIKREIISDRLKTAISETLSAGEQAILFLNRRGFAPFVLCTDCGYNFICPNCNVSMVYHSQNHYIRCHYCNYTLGMPEACPQCRGVRLRNFGWGTEQVEEAVRKLFPSARTLRLDRDTTLRKGSHSRAYMEMSAGRKDILIGTQMITKGFHFPKVTLVGIILAEQGLNFPDFRASERTFQLIVQVAGRAGRGDKKGKVIIQTFDPEQEAITCAGKGDYIHFYNNEIKHREDLCYPPFSRIAAIRVNGGDKGAVEAACRRIIEAINGSRERDGLSESVSVLGPAPAPISRLKGVLRWLILLKAEKQDMLHPLIRSAFSQIQGSLKNVRIAIDIDPQALI